MLKPQKCLYIKHFGGFSTFRNSHFPNRFQLRFQTSSDALFWMSCFEILAHPGAKMLDFGIPWRPVVPKMAPKIAQMVPKRACRATGVDSFSGSQNRLASKIAFGALLGTIWLILGPPWHQNHRFSFDCSTHFDEILGINSGRPCSFWRKRTDV